MDRCENCDRVIGKMETPRVLLGKVVCVECDVRLRAQVAPMQSPPLQASPVVMQMPVQSNRITVALLAIFLGGLGIHRFALGHTIGILYVLFFWTCIPALIGLCEGIGYLMMTDEAFIATYQTPRPVSAPNPPNWTYNPPPPQPRLPQQASASLPRATVIPTMPDAPTAKPQSKSFGLS